MDKIASTHKLQEELQRLLDIARTPYPSRAKLATELRSLADRLVLAKITSDDWTKKGDKWLMKAQYAGGKKHEWSIKETAGKFNVTVGTPEGTFKKKKGFDSLEQAQKFANRYIDRADGWELLEKSLDKDFAKA